MPRLPDEYVYEVCDRFLRGDRVTAIRKWINEALRAAGRKEELTREQVYVVLRDAQRRGFFWLRPPLDVALQRRIADVYRKPGDQIAVVPVRGKRALDQVAMEAAVLALRLIRKVAASKAKGDPRVRLGLGAGFTTRAVVQHLVALLRTEANPPPLACHALTAGFAGDQPSVAPVAFFGLFDTLDLDIEHIGLFAPSMVRCGDYDNVRQQPGLREAFAMKRDIDIVITSLASADDEHGALTKYLHEKREDVELLRRAGWVGDVQYRPYSAQGPLLLETGVRAVTLFELSELVALARMPRRHVMLVSGPCSRCEKTRADGLRPLLTVPELAVWSHLILDLQTAEDLLPADADVPKPR